MKKLLTLVLALSFFGCNELQQVVNQIPQSGPLGNAEIAQGLQQALDLGIKKQVSKLSEEDCFFRNERVKIVLP